MSIDHHCGEQFPNGKPALRHPSPATYWIRFAIQASALIVACTATCCVSFLAFGWLDRLLTGTNLAAGSPLFTHRGLIKALMPLGAFALAALSLTFEVWGLGWRNSSLRRILFSPSNSTKTDLFYLVLFASGFAPVLSFLFSLGIGYSLNLYVQRTIHLKLLAEQNFVVSLTIVTVVNTFLFYWHHRLMHTRLLWQLHTVHHSAEEMNLITPHRNHPIDKAIARVVYAVPTAMLGARPEVLVAFIVANGLYQQMVHSHWDWNLRRYRLGWIESYVLISSTAHRLHHSTRPQHYNKNFGICPIWDRMFGTWCATVPDELHLGLRDKSHNSGRPWHEILMLYFKFVRILRTELQRRWRSAKSLFRRNTGSSGRTPPAPLEVSSDDDAVSATAGAPSPDRCSSSLRGCCSS